MDKNAVRKVLLDAANLLETKGWCRCTNAKTADYRECSATDEKAASWCTVGAIFKIAGNSLDRWSPVEYLTDFLGKQCVQNWNDAEGRTKEEVITTLRNAADSLEDKEVLPCQLPQFPVLSIGTNQTLLV